MTPRPDRRARRAAPRRAREEWDAFMDDFLAQADVAPDEAPEERAARRARLEADPEAWFAHYFRRYCTAPPAAFHRAATRRLLADPAAFEVRAWSRELAKSTRAMMEAALLALTGRARLALFVSNSLDNAVRLLSPLKRQLEGDRRIAADYGPQPVEGRWEDAEFTARCGCSFRAVGAGQSPRGARNAEARPDLIVVDDIDTDEACRNPDRVRQVWEWVEGALLGTRSVSAPCRVLFLGNIIARDSVIARATRIPGARATVVNIRDKQGRSTWPEKNSEEAIDRILSQVSARAAQQEYFNNPLAEGEVFREMAWGRVPPLSRFRLLVAYGDPAPSENRARASSTKCVVLCGLLRGTLYVVDCRLDRGLNQDFISWFAEMDDRAGGQAAVYNVVENNRLQDPFFRQVFTPLAAAKRAEPGREGFAVLPDALPKTDKGTRIEANLQPLAARGALVLNEAERGNPHMRRLEEQFLMFSLRLKYPADGPDCVEGALRWLRLKHREADPVETIAPEALRRRNKFRL